MKVSIDSILYLFKIYFNSAVFQLVAMLQFGFSLFPDVNFVFLSTRLKTVVRSVW